MGKKPTWDAQAAEEAARKAAYRKALEEEFQVLEAAVRKSFIAWLLVSSASRGG